MAANRKPASTKAKQNTNGKRGAVQAPPKPDRRWSILLFALGGLFVLFCLLTGDAGGVWVQKNIVFGVFGISGWLMGPYLIYLGVLLIREKPLGAPALKGAFVLAVLSGLVLVAHNLDFTDATFTQVVTKAFENGAAGKAGGGVLGVLLGGLSQYLFGRVIALVVLVLMQVFAVMLFFSLTPGHIVRFFRGLADRIPKVEYADDDFEDDEEEYDETPDKEIFDIEAQENLRRSIERSRTKRQMVDIPLPGEGPVSTPGLGHQEEVEIPVGGTFGKKPLDELAEPPLQAQDLTDEVGDGLLLFGADDPLALPRRTGLEPKGQVYDWENIDDTQPDTLDFDLFGNPVTTPGMRRPQQLDIAPEPEPLPATPGFFGEQAGEATLREGESYTPPQDTPQDAAPQPSSDLNLEHLIQKADTRRPDMVATTAQAERAPVYAYQPPPLRLFGPTPVEEPTSAKEEMRHTAELLVSTLASFGVQTRILDVSRGPSVTRYEVQPQAGVKISRITNLADDIALNLAAAGVRIEAPIPGKPAVGIEVPNKKKSTVSIRSVLESAAFADSSSPLPIALGKDIAGDCVVADLTKMPHLLIAGSTGSGKSVCVNATIMSFLYSCTPDELKLVLIDPKVVELAEYNGIPHLLMPVVTEPKKAASALGTMVAEMEKRYHLFAENNVRDIKTFNKLAMRRSDLDKLPYIAIIIDELADLMMTSGKEVEDYICRIAQKARAAGMHLVVATQRPSVDVITGLIKANIPSRIAFAVSSQVDSRTILDGAGAEKLLGMGDMLFMPVGANKPVRVQGTFVKDQDITNVLDAIKRSNETQYDEALMEEMERRAAADTGKDNDGEGDDNILADETFISAVDLALELGGISTSFLQRRLRLGYARAGRIVDEMERLHIVGGPNGSKPRELLINRQQWQEMSMNAVD